MGDFGDDYMLPLEDELEMVQAMYTEEEVQVSDEGVELDCQLKRVWGRAKLLIDQNEYPRKAPTFILTKTRGLLEQQCKDLERQVQEVMKDNFPNNCLVQVLDCVMEIFRNYDDVGECSICMQPIQFNNSSEGYCAPTCWHQFHVDCLAAWWKQKDSERLSASSTQDAQQAREGRQRAVQSQVDTQDQILEEARTKQKNLRETKQNAQELIAFLAGGGVIEPTEEGEKVPTKASLTAEVKACNRGLAELEKKFAVITSRKDKLGAELEALRTKASEEVTNERLHGVDCPVCRCHIPYSALEHFLFSALDRMCNPENGSDVVLPSTWTQEQQELSDVDKSEVYRRCISNMDEDVQKKVLEMQRKLQEDVQRRKRSDLMQQPE